MARSPSERPPAERQAQIHGYAKTVRWMKILLPLASLILIATIFLIDRDSADSLFSAEELARLGAGMQLEEPRFTGATEAGEPFLVSARRALPDGPVPDMIELIEPMGQITLEDGTLLEGRAARGQISRKAQEMTFSDNVILTTSEGHRVQTNRLLLDIERRQAHAPGQIAGFGPQGSIEAGAMRILRADADDPDNPNDMVILFEKGVRVVFIPEESR